MQDVLRHIRGQQQVIKFHKIFMIKCDDSNEEYWIVKKLYAQKDFSFPFVFGFGFGFISHIEKMNSFEIRIQTVI